MFKKSLIVVIGISVNIRGANKDVQDIVIFFNIK